MVVIETVIAIMKIVKDKKTCIMTQSQAVMKLAESDDITWVDAFTGENIFSIIGAYITIDM